MEPRYRSIGGQQLAGVPALAIVALAMVAACGERMSLAHPESDETILDDTSDRPGVDTTAEASFIHPVDSSGDPESVTSGEITDATSVVLNTQDGSCPAVTDQMVIGEVEDSSFDEISGVAASWSYSGILWVHNDHGDSARVSAIDSSGATRAIVAMPGIDAEDWEDIASDGTYIYIGETGNNNMPDDDEPTIFRIVEPKLTAEGPVQYIEDGAVETLNLRYPDGAHNCETIMVDGATGDIYLVSKPRSGDRVSSVYRAAAPTFNTGEIVELEKVADLGEQTSTGGDISANADAVLIRTYDDARYFPRLPDESLSDALNRGGCEVPVSDYGIAEAITFRPDNLGYITIREGENPPILSHDFVEAL